MSDEGNITDSVARYRRLCLVISLVALALAFASKYYAGPHQRFADAYLGDAFIVICLYFWLALLWPHLRILTKSALISGLAVGVELLQATDLPASLHLPAPFVFVLGTSYDRRDFIFYGLGVLIAALVEKILTESRARRFRNANS
ncbi:DUF2809 domain-containing protein [candidate division KSB1 bacterium]|nr:DUF2809 domain-containing protein [candidate division KSB1 bacterium]